MKIRFGYITLVSMLVMLMHSCIEYDMSYPRQLAEFSVFEVEDAENVSIDPSTMTVTITLDEAADLADVHVIKAELKDGDVFKSGSFPERLDLSQQPHTVLLSNHHDYRWTIKAVQPVDRYVACANQVGEAFFDVENREAYVYVSMSQRLKYLTFTDIKLELAGSKVVSTTGETTQDCSFPYETASPLTLDCTNRRTFKVSCRGEEMVWGLTAIPVLVPAQIVSVAPWCWTADVKATFDGTSQPPTITYKKAADQEWLEIAEDYVTIDGINCNFHLVDLEPGTSYEVKLFFEGEELPGTSFTTDTPDQLYNFDFDQWCTPNNGGLWYPYAQDATVPTWDSANQGTAGFGLGSSTTPFDRDGGKAVMMTSKYVAVKFAAGNLFTGKFRSVIGTKGADLDWGVSFTSKPKALKGMYKYQPALVNYQENKKVNTPTEYDQGQIQVILIQTECPYRVLPVDLGGGKTLNGPTYIDQTKLIDLESHETIIARGVMTFGISDQNNDGQADWIEFELPLEYRDFRTPTYVIVTAASSYLGDYFTGGDGSVLYIDDFEFIYE